MEYIRKIKNLTDRHLAWLESGHLTDCEFVIGSETIKCHRLILSLESPVFEACFNGPLAHEGDMDVITIVDISAPHLKQFIKFLYTDIISFSGNDLDMVFGVCFCAEKYQVDRLKDLCINFLRTHLNVTNCLKIYQGMELLTVQELEWDLLDILQEETTAVLHSGIISDLSVHTLIRVLNLKYLAVNEYTLIQHILNSALATQHLEVENEDEEINSLREVVAPILPYFRFKTLSINEFQLLCNNFDFITQDMIQQITECLENDGVEMPIGFSNESEQRFAPVENVLIHYYMRERQVHGTSDHSTDLWELCFQLEVGAATIHGIMLRGSRYGQSDMPAQLERLNIEARNRTKGITITNVNFQGMVAQGENVLINFDRPFVIRSNCIYSITLHYKNQKLSFESFNSRVIVTMTHPSIRLRAFYPKYTHISEILISQNFKRQQ